MPKVCLETPELIENVARPVVMQVVRHVGGHVGLPPTTKIRYAGGSGVLPTPGSTLDDKGAGNRLPGDVNLSIEVNEEYVEENALSVGVLRPENIVFFADDKLEVYLKPVYQRVKVDISVSYTAPDRTTATAWLQTMKRRVSQEFDEVLHMVDYHFPIPLPLVLILTEIHRLRENEHGYGDDIGTYLREHFSDKFTTVTDQAGNNPVLVIRESQIAIPGWYDFNANPPKPEKENDTGVWSVSFTHTFHYDRPESVVMEYPLMVHNQLLDNRFRNDTKPAELEDVVQNPSLSIGVLKDYTYESRMARAWMAMPGIPIPHFDDWLPGYELPDTQTIMRIMLQVDTVHPKNIINLANLGDWAMKPEAIKYMRGYPVGQVVPYESIFSVTLHRKRSMVDCKKLIITNDLDVFSVEDLNPREPYHLLVSMLYDPRRLSIAALRRLAKYGTMAITYLTTLDPTLSASKLLPLLNADGSITIASLKAAIEYVSVRGRHRYAGNNYYWNLVGAFAVSAARSE